MLKAIGITRRITLLSWTVTLVALAIFVAIIIPDQKRGLRAELESKASGEAVGLKGEVSAAAISEDYASVVEHATEAMAGDPSLEFLVITKNDGFSIFVQRNGWRTQSHTDRFWYPVQRQSEGEIGVVPILAGRLFHYQTPIDYNGVNWGWIHVGLSLSNYDQRVRKVYWRTGLIALACVLMSLLVSTWYARRIVRPIFELKSVVEKVAAGDLEARAEPRSHDEVEDLAKAFNGMADSILTRDLALSEAKRDLERRVLERTYELREQIIAKDAAHADLAEAQKSLVELSRLSGMAEVATGILHNVGNVLNSVNVSASILAEGMNSSRVHQFRDLVALLDANRDELGKFLETDKRGRRILPYMSSLSRHLENEQNTLRKEVASLMTHINHIKEIVVMQQTYARASGVFEKVSPTELVEDVLGISRENLRRYDIVIRKEYEDVPMITTDRHKVLQILLNVLRNAKDALKNSQQEKREIVLSIRRKDEVRVTIQIKDNGVGIDPHNLIRIFSHGFTTKKDGHGFGLHSGALAAYQLGGALTAESNGPGLGACFTLELPIQAPISSEG